MQSLVNGNCIDASHSLQGNIDVKPLEKEDMVRLMRLFLEALEMALHLCNTFLKSFGPNRVSKILSFRTYKVCIEVFILFKFVEYRLQYNFYLKLLVYKYS